MARKSKFKMRNASHRIPKRENVAGIVLKDDTAIFITNDMLVKQLRRDGPTVARSFDDLTKGDIAECSKVFGRCQAHLIPYLPQSDETGFQVTAARLLFSALNAYVASIEVARHGYPRQYGASARLVVETISVVLDIATVTDSLEKFHSGKLNSTKSITAAKKCLPIIGEIYGLLSNDFVHIGPGHAALEGPSIYKRNDQALSFITTTLRALIVLIEVTVDLVFGGATTGSRYWRAEGAGWRFDPDDEVKTWLEQVLQIDPPS